jgi:HTH-type transcriptional regulator, global nitrogen regulator NrpRI
MNACCENTGRKAHQGQQPAGTNPSCDKQHNRDQVTPAVTLNPDTSTGCIILNITCVASEAFAEAVRVVKSVLASPYAFSNRLAVARGGTCIGDFAVPIHKTAICTVCSMTLNALLLNHGIHASIRFGGVVEVENHQPKKFSTFLSPPGRSSLAPLEVFITCAMTSVCETLACGSGEVLGSFLEIPEGGLPEAKKLYERIKKIGMGGKIMFGMPNQPLLGMPVSIGNAGIVVFRDLNTAAALTEKGITAEVSTVKMLYDYTALK